MRRKNGCIQNRGTSWRISYYDLNHSRQYETYFTEEEAQRELAKRLADLAQGLPVSSKPQTVKFGELCDDVVTHYEVNKLKSRDDIECRYRVHIVPVLGHLKAVTITTAQLNKYIQKRQAEEAAAGTIARELEAIKRAFLLGKAGNKIFTSPHIPKIKETNIRKGFFTRDEVERLCSFLPEPYSSFTMFGFLTGWRYGEIQNLKWSNVDFAADEIRLDPGTTKNGEGRIFPMNPELRALLLGVKVPTATNAVRRTEPRMRANIVTAPAHHVFSINGRPIGVFRKNWKRACFKAGLPCVISKDGKVVKAVRIFHDLRRSAARWMEQQGLSRSVIMQLMGHQTESMFTRYRIVDGGDLREAVKRLNGARDGARKKS